MAIKGVIGEDDARIRIAELKAQVLQAEAGGNSITDEVDRRDDLSRLHHTYGIWERQVKHCLIFGTSSKEVSSALEPVGYDQFQSGRVLEWSSDVGAAYRASEIPR